MNIFKTSSRPIVNISRIIYLIVSAIAGITLAYSGSTEAAPISWSTGASMAFFIGCVVISLESWLKGYSLSAFTHATFGLLIGLLCWSLINWALQASLLEEVITRAFPAYGKFLVNVFFLTTMTAFGFVGTVLALRSSKDDFALVIPYVRFKEDSVIGQPMVIDISTLIDGRLSALIKAGFVKGRIIIPKIIFEELQIMVNSPSGSNRSRGERGLHNLEELQKQPSQEVSIFDPPNVQQTDSMESILIQTAIASNARVITLDESISTVAELRDVPCLNIEMLNKALNPIIAAGSRVDLRLTKQGKDDHQAVGQLPDGPIIVVNKASQYIGSTRPVYIVSTINTTAGIMAFAELEENYLNHSNES